MRVLIAGLGAIGQRHARNLRALHGETVELLAYRIRRLPFVVTASLERDDSRDVEEALQVRAFDDIDEALSADPDVVFVCTPSSLHVDIAQRAAMAGCHLFIEKPVAHTLEGLETLRQTVRRNALVAAVGCQWRYHPCVRWLVSLLRRGELGRLHRAEIDYAEYLPDWHPYEDYRQSYAARADLGGGVILTQIHDFDLAWHLFGPPTAVTATGGHLSNLQIDVEDTADTVLHLDATSVRIRQTFASRVNRRSISVVGEHGTATVDLLRAHATTEPTLGPDLTIDDYRRNQMFLDELQDFERRLAGRDASIATLDEGIAVLKVALAVKEAIHYGRTVEFA